MPLLYPEGGLYLVGTRTSTRSFGASKRENHDSAAFYNSRLYDHLELVELNDLRYQEVPKTCWIGSSTKTAGT